MIWFWTDYEIWRDTWTQRRNVSTELEWNSSHAGAGELISQCGDPFCKYIQNLQFLRTNEVKKRYKDIKKLTITSTISRPKVVPKYVYLLSVLSKWKIGTQWYMCLLLLIQNRMLVDGSFIAYIYSLLVLKTKTIHFHEEQICSLQAVWIDKWQWRVNCQEEKSTYPRLSITTSHW